MDSNSIAPKPRVSGAQMADHKGGLVCALGRMKQMTSQDGSRFLMTMSDGMDVEVFMNEPLTEPPEGIVEIVGEVGSNPQTIKCLSILNHGDVEFDMALYNEAVNITRDFPQFYKVGVTDGQQYSESM